MTEKIRCKDRIRKAPRNKMAHNVILAALKAVQEKRERHGWQEPYTVPTWKDTPEGGRNTKIWEITKWWLCKPQHWHVKSRYYKGWPTLERTIEFALWQNQKLPEPLQADEIQCKRVAERAWTNQKARVENGEMLKDFANGTSRRPYLVALLGRYKSSEIRSVCIGVARSPPST